MITKTKICGTSDIDFITNLPEGVIGHILSYLPIEDVMRTSVLSKSWEFKWAFASNVELSSQTSTQASSLVNIADKMLVRMGSLRRFSLSSIIRGDDDLSRVTALLHALFRRDIEILELQIGYRTDPVLPVFSLSVLTRSSLRTFGFTMDCILKVPAENSFPNLRKLSLIRVNILNEDEDSDGTLIFTFPVLETLVVAYCNWLEVKCLEIHAPALIDFNISTDPYKSNEPHSYSIKVLGSCLSTFNFFGGSIENIILTGSTVAYAGLNCYPANSNSSLENCGLQVRKLLRELSNIKTLVLSQFLPAIWATKLGPPLPRFGKLEELHVCPSFPFEGLLEFLCATPFLRTLELRVDPTNDFEFDEVQSPPSCVLNHLEEVIFDCYELEPDHDFGVEKFILKNGLRLKTVLVDVHESSSVEDYVESSRENYIVEQLSTFPRGSTCLTISLRPQDD